MPTAPCLLAGAARSRGPMATKTLVTLDRWMNVGSQNEALDALARSATPMPTNR